MYKAGQHLVMCNGASGTAHSSEILSNGGFERTSPSPDARIQTFLSNNAQLESKETRVDLGGVIFSVCSFLVWPILSFNA